MSQKEAPRPGLVKAALEGKITNREGAKALGLSIRQFQRLKRRFERSGLQGLVHGRRGCRSTRRIPETLRQRVLGLMKTSYAGLNDCHLTEKLWEKEDLPISRESVRRLRQGAGLPSQRPRRPPRCFQRRLREARSGQMVLLDGSSFAWLGEHTEPFCAQAAQDDATGAIVGLTFRPHEDLHGYAVVLDQVFRQKGLPLSFYGDRTTVFVQGGTSWSLEEELQGYRNPTQLGQALKELGIIYIPAQTPQAKGRIERLWGTLHDRLTAELRLAGVQRFEEALAFLPSFIEDFNRRFAHPARESAPIWRRAPRQLERVLSCRYQRVVARDGTVSLFGRSIQLPARSRCRPGSRVQVRELLDGRVLVLEGDRLLTAVAPLPGPFALTPRNTRRARSQLPRPAPRPAPPKAARSLKDVRTPWRPSTDHPWHKYRLIPAASEDD